MRKKKNQKEKVLKSEKDIKQLVGKIMGYDLDKKTDRNTGYQDVFRIHAFTETCLIFEVVSSYEAPAITFSMLKEFSSTFGTDSIDVHKGINQPGCETCDFGSAYGHIVSINNATKNLTEMLLRI